MDEQQQPPRIQRLSASAIAQIRSTVSLTNLAGAVQELLMNSIDANATTINIFINIIKNSIVIEDDGEGIIPDDMILVGNRYSTSKSTSPSSQTFGSRGEFLSSLATSSLLTIYSRSQFYRSTHAVRYHYGSRLVCGQIENDHLMLPKSGTKVIVDRLFGNFPVRLVGREDMTATEIAREWKDIGRKVVEVLLLCANNGRDVKVVVRNEEGVRKAVFDIGGGDESGMSVRIGNVVDQAGFGKTLWEKISGEWRGITMKGVIALVPAADRERQFIFVNGSPVGRHTNSILYSKINGLFTGSSFGTIDENIAPEAGKRWVVRKGVERHPSFVIFVETSGSLNMVHAEDLEVDSGNTILLDVTSLIEAVADEFLKVGGWKKRAAAMMPKKKADEDEDIGTKWVPKRRADLALDLIYPSRMKSSHSLAAQSLNGAKTRRVMPEPAERPPPEELMQQEDIPTDDPGVLRYLDPETNQHILLDARTGNGIRTPKPQAMPKRLTLLPEQRKGTMTTKGWTSNIVSSFKNPVYRNPEAQIPRKSMISDTFKGDEHISTARLSKSSLQTARVIAQVDEKFILLFFQPLELLVIVDQHAADERIRVERLWKEFDNVPKPLKKEVSFSINADEANILRLYLDDIRTWGFELDITPIRGAHGAVVVDVVGVPELVADRCVSEPSVVVRLLRGWIAELKDEKRSRGFPDSRGGWIKRMVTATQRLNEVVSSRACRSAIMFNDKLTLEECRDLINKLAACDFPFQCAHGRPSMVPVIDLADDGVETRFKEDACGNLCFQHD
ncbi:DNA mismatch repair protein [Orbilia oligospora]|nr:DNA mismatch repair protein [Orbilia oligospora]KAF3254759.1 DNA mismatch repair protein [Orbilia oligospora]KAF3254760.1 DNA mismatch repair protein, variant 2 [Orbilia oligospora]KAF3269054.1 DNA mismatch repair protein [Orbilia oligospora]KAF3290543.1 DNA mismatch repair protein [Orbilia oligospora]